ncbi:MAG: hypothetical protein EA402_05010 [Planctomycetota bacterium]|nr:MAG: hypothetical protein EA402_05010 [Planctomycetota bacterium]
MNRQAVAPWQLPALGIRDALLRRCQLLSLGGHLLAILLILGWDSLLSWLQREPTILPASQKHEAPPTRIVFSQEAVAAIEPGLLPALPDLPAPTSDEGPALRPLLDEDHRLGRGAGDAGGEGSAIESVQLPPAMALPLPEEGPRGGGMDQRETQLRQEQEANYFLMGFLLRKYRSDWKPIYGDRLPRRTFVLWIEHDRSRIVSADFARGSSTGIPELDRAIIAWLVEDNAIDLSPLRHSPNRLPMTVDLYQAHR